MAQRETERERDVYICDGSVGLHVCPAGFFFSDQESAIEYVSSVNTKETPGIRLIADGLRSTMTEDIVWQS